MKSLRKTIELAGIGSVDLVRSRRARRLRLSVSPFRRPRMSIPYRISWARAEAFAIEQEEWLAAQLRNMEQLENRTLSLVEIPAEISMSRVRKLLEARLAELAEHHGYSYRRVRFGRQRTLWGSCSSRGTISLNYQLALLPDALRDYVLVHELVHTRFPGHDAAFWQELERVLPGARALRNKLKRIPLLPPERLPYTR